MCWIPRKLALPVVIACVAAACCAAECSPDRFALQASGEYVISIPADAASDGVDAVVLEKDGRAVAMEYSVENGTLSVTPSRDLNFGSVYDVKIFSKSGKRHCFHAGIAPYIKLDTAKENVIRMPAKPSKGFSCAYYLKIPLNTDKRSDRRLLVQGNNTSPNSLRQFFEEEARRQASTGWAGSLARSLETPCLVPAFTRQRDYHDKDYYYPQFLDGAAVEKDKTDLQLVAMIRDAKEELAYNGIKVPEKVFLFGYSSDGKFAQRFTVLHPDMVMATVAGGVAGCATIPMTEYKGEKLNYPVGVANIKELTGTDFNKDEFAQVPQFFLMGETDDNDATEWRDCYRAANAEQIWRLFGRKQLPDRWEVTRKVLAQAAPQIKCKTYTGIGHSVTNDVRDDMIGFLKDHWSR